MFSYSNSGGNAGTWSSPTPIETAGDRGYYAAPAISPSGSDVYVTYNAYNTPFQQKAWSGSTPPGGPRLLVGVEKHSDIAGGVPTGWAEIHRGAQGDARGSSQNNLRAEFLGDYVYTIATNTYGAGVWNDARNAADCPLMDRYWDMLREGTATTSSTDPNRPAPQQDCAATFGNTDIYGGSWLDPTP